MDIGNRIRTLRIKKNLTLQELASRTELSKGFLSQIEHNLSSPSIQTLEDITEALGMKLSDFFAEEAQEQIVFGTKDEFVDEQEDYVIHWIVPNAQKNKMEPIILDLQPGKSSQLINPHDGEEIGYVLSGRVKLCFADQKKNYTVKKGETFYIKGNIAHYLLNGSNKLASVLWISTPPIF